MRLTRVFVEAFRGIPRLDLGLDPVTVLIGENNNGKTSVFDVLGLCLARRDGSTETRFREDDFYRHSGDSARPIRIILTFEPDPGETELHGLDAAITPREDGAPSLRAEFFGVSEDRIVRRRFVDRHGQPLDPQPPPAMMARLRDLHPVLLLRFAQPYQGQPQTPDEPTSAPERRGRRSLETRITRVFHDLTHTRGPLPAKEIARGLRAARSLFGRDDDSGDASLHRMLNDILSDSATWGRPQDSGAFRVRAGSGSHTIGLLLVLGAMLEVRGEEALSPDARPIIAIEEPAAHLHPILLASTWDVIEALGTQTIVTTNSGELLSSVPMKSLRRLVRGDSEIAARQLRDGTLSESDLRRLGYHIRAKRGGVLFARCWLLVEGESEFWLMSHLAHVLGYDLEAEGVRCVEFAQCGVTPLVRLANDLRIEWHLLADGDDSGQAYAKEASRHLGRKDLAQRVSRLPQRDIEHCLWDYGFDAIYREAAHHVPRPDADDRRYPPGRVIANAVRKKSKPYLALMVADACAARGSDSVPPVLRGVIETSIALARESVADDTLRKRTPAGP